MLDPGTGGSGGYTSPFPPYPASDFVVINDGDTLVDRGGEFANVAMDAYAKAWTAALETDGLLQAPTVAQGNERYQEAIQLKDAAILAGGCTRKFGHAIGVYDDGIQTLDGEYWTAKADNFGITDVDPDDPTVKADPEKADKRHDQMLAAAEQEVMGGLTKRKLQMDETLDEEATGTASMLDKGPSDEAILALFQSGNLPVIATSLFPDMDFSKLDMRSMLEQLAKFGELPPGVAIDDVMNSLDELKKIADGDGEPGDLVQALENLKELAPGAFDYLVLGMTDDQLAQLDEMATSGNPLYGLDKWGVIDFHSLFLSNVSSETLFRLENEWPSIEPDLGGTEGEEDGDIEMPHWGDPPEDNELYGYDDDGNLDISADDVDQGMLGDCWMQAKLGALAEQHPDWVTDHVMENANGTITVVMYDDDGNAHNVTVTDQIPVNDSGDPVFAGNSGTDANWSIYYEKAFALTEGDGSYADVEGGSTDEAADLMTGNDAGDIDDEGGFLGMGQHDSMDDVREQYENGEAVVVSTSGDEKEENGAYVSNHVFYVKGFTDDGSIILGNPWGADDPDLILTEDQFNDYIDGASVINP